MGISFLFSFAFHFFSQLFLRPPQTIVLPVCISFSWEWFWPLSPVLYYKPPSIVHQALCLSDLVPWIYHIHSIILRDLIYVTPGFSSGFLYFPQFKFEFCIEKLMIWATDSSVLFLLTVRNFSIFDYKEYNQFDFSIDHLVISMCTVFSCVIGRGYLL